jgi:hypothetical protein
VPDLRDTITHFSLGVVTSGEPDREDLKNALVRGDNMMFAKIAARMATIRKRHGCTLVNSTPFANTSATAGPAIAGGEHYLYDNSGSEVRYTTLVMANGTVVLTQDDGSSTNLTAAATLATILGSGIEAPDFAMMNNRLFILDGLGAGVSLKGTTQVDWGVAPWTITSAAEGAAGSMTGDYELVVTLYNAQTSSESEISDITAVTVAANKKIDLVLPSKAVGLTHFYARLYIRKPAEGPGLYRVLAGTGYVGGDTMGFPLASAGPTVAVTIDVSDVNLEDYILTAPAIGSRGLPPSGVKWAAVFANRLFVADDTTIYWSEQDMPDAFNPNNAEPIRSPNGGYVRGIQTVPIDADNSILSIHTATARHQLSGTTDPATWDWTVADPELGTVSHRSVIVQDGLLFWWTPRQGPVMRDPSGGEVAFIGRELIADKTGPTAINPSVVRLISGDGDDGRVVWAVPDPQEVRNTRMVVFNTQMRRWESPNWDPMDAACVFQNFTTNASSYLAFGNYNGQLFRLLKGSNDGVRAGTTSGTLVAASDSLLTITDGAASFDTTGAGLIERKVTLLGPDGLVHGEVRPHISANTSTGLTLSEAFTGLTVGATYTYLIGGPNFAIETYWWNMGEAFIKKRFDFLYLQFRADSGISQVIMNTAFSYDALNDIETTALDFTSESWDTAFWDLAYWDSVAVLNRKISLIKVGVNARVQIRNPYPDQGFEVTKIGLLARELNDA